MLILELIDARGVRGVGKLKDGNSLPVKQGQPLKTTLADMHVIRIRDDFGFRMICVECYGRSFAHGFKREKFHKYQGGFNIIIRYTYFDDLPVTVGYPSEVLVFAQCILA